MRSITLALVFYTMGVWAERLKGTLKWWHAAAFAVGLSCDVTGTILMAIHLCWAVVVLIRNRPSEKASLHKFSIIVWVIWLIPYFTSAIGAMITG